PSRAHDQSFRQWWARFLRMSASRTGIATLMRMNAEIDVRHVLPAIRVPTLILHSTNDRAVDVGNSRYMARRIEGARLVELPGPDHLPFLSDAEIVLAEIEEFLTGVRPAPEIDRVCSPPCCSPISSAPPNGRHHSAIAAGTTSSTVTTRWCGVS